MAYSQIGKAIANILKSVDLIKSGQRLGKHGEVVRKLKIAVELAKKSKQPTTWLFKIWSRHF